MSKEGLLVSLDCLDQAKTETGFVGYKVVLGNFINTSVIPSGALVLRDNGSLPFARLKEVGFGLDSRIADGNGSPEILLDPIGQTVEIQDDTLTCLIKSESTKMVEINPKTKKPGIIKSIEASLLGAFYLVSPDVRKLIAQDGLVILRETVYCQFNLIGKGILVPGKFEILPDEQKTLAEIELVTTRPQLIRTLNDQNYNPFAIVVRL